MYQANETKDAYNSAINAMLKMIELHREETRARLRGERIKDRSMLSGFTGGQIEQIADFVESFRAD